MISNAGLDLLDQEGDDYRLMNPNTGEPITVNKNDINREFLDKLVGKENPAEAKKPIWTMSVPPSSFLISSNLFRTFFVY